MIGEREQENARLLFEVGWSSGDPLAPLLFFADDAVMRDLVGYPGAMRGKQAIRDYWTGRGGPIVLRVPVEDVFAGEAGVAVQWMAYAQILDDSAGPENRGKWRCGEGMSRLEFDDEGKVTLEVDYWHGMQGICDSWVEHFQRRKRMTRAERGAISGA